jgi:hypothetical protein
VVLVELRLELAVESTDQFLSGLLVCQEPISDSCQPLIHVSAEIVSSAIKMLLQRVELSLHVANSLGLLHS